MSLVGSTILLRPTFRSAVPVGGVVVQRIAGDLFRVVLDDGEVRYLTAGEIRMLSVR